MLLITDGDRPVAIAGVMGGANSEIGGGTDKIILESANFDFISIRKTSQILGLRTESSMRFEKALDPNLCELALARAVELVKKLCPRALVVSKLVDEKKFNLNQGPIELDLEWINKFMGENVEVKKVVETLNRLGFSAEKSPEGKLSVTIPTWRARRDISTKEDLAEEVARIYGYDNLTPLMPRVEMKSPLVNKEKVLEKKIKNILAEGTALIEVYNYSFVSEEQLKKLGIDFSTHLRLANPISAKGTMLRQNLAPNVILNIKTNQARFEEIKIFEIGSIFLPEMSGEENKNNEADEKLPYQEKRLGIVVAGSNGKQDVFRKTKGVVEHLLSHFDLPVVFNTRETIPGWADQDVSADIEAGQKTLGLVCKLDKKISQSLGIKKEAAVAEISLKELFNVISQKENKKYQAYEKFPPVIRDLAFVVRAKILYNDIRGEIINFDELIKSVELFDVYQGGKLGKDKKNLAFHIIYQADKTLTSGEVDKIQQSLIKHVEEKFEAKIRNF